MPYQNHSGQLLPAAGNADLRMENARSGAFSSSPGPVLSPSAEVWRNEGADTGMMAGVPERTAQI